MTSQKSTKRVHVLHVVPVLGIGGMELALSRIVRGLKSSDMSHSVCCLKGEAVIRDLLEGAASIYCMHAKPRELGLPLRLCKLIRELRPTVVHVRNWGAWPDVALARLLVGSYIPLIFSFHGLEHAGHFEKHVRLAFRVLSQMTTHLFTVSQATHRLLVDQVGLRPGRIGIIPNGVDVEALSPCSKSEQSDTVVVGSVGGLKPVKNHDLLVRACAAAIAEGARLELRIAGEGPERDQIEQTAAGLGIIDRLRLPGSVSDIPNFLRSLDIFVLPSNAEAHPNALLEAMACGLSCIGTAVGGIPETLNFGQAGIIVNPGDVDALSKAISLLARDRAMRDTLGKSARERTCRVYSLQGMLRAYDTLYRQLALEARPRVVVDATATTN